MTPLPIAVSKHVLPNSVSTDEESRSDNRGKPTEIRTGTTSTAQFPSSRKVHVSGALYPQIRVPMREISLAASEVVYGQAKGKLSSNPPLTVYDTSGPYTDPDVSVDLRKGLPPLRLAWIKARGDVESYPARLGRPEEN